ncbi:hypothetical protein CAPTEDRAFT_171705 [Capitella teleta]|uniref:Malonyl-CoA decarboxylase C-terminal domain-containing protein n=1 Tax=Capitella teleta TaxID=283909 RepID=R7UT28_CAPTE|nr:hypothetical protein CAPTEDRAFT_171705 [Capitella teleta]|eukprot:ELU09365.1 hypothetical protein CAPTEDRAFT_171705 [Capitella teleta]
MRDLCGYYSGLIQQDKVIFLKMLARDYGVQQEDVLQFASMLATSSQDIGTASILRIHERLRKALVPPYQSLFTQISHVDNGVKFLVDLRTDILNALLSSGDDRPFMAAMNSCLLDLLRLWFSVGFFQVERITWESPCDMLQKISDKEAVHPIRNWYDLKRRVGPYRRCFVFMHNSMPREPVVILHTALTDSITSSIQTLVSRSPRAEDIDEIKEDPGRVTTAIFYSITATQRGLAGVDLGNYLIKNTVKELLLEYPQMHQFSSLSPIPGFHDWLSAEITRYLHLKQHPSALLSASDLQEIQTVLASPNKPLMETLQMTLKKATWAQNESLARVLEAPLMRLCARYLYCEKQLGFARNPVANFHLRNGAVMWRLNWLADTSPRGLNNSLGMMINYRYYLDETESNSKKYIENQSISVSDQILELVSHLPQKVTSSN